MLLRLDDLSRVADLRQWVKQSTNLPVDSFYLTSENHLVNDEDHLCHGKVYHCVPRVLGGKGGFGSMLRAIGAQIEKTTSREACRDLSGRRMRDVNNEKKLKEWLSKQADREREKEEKRQERLARRRAQPQHNFDDPDYVDQRTKVAESQEEALQKGLVRQKTGAAATVTSADVRRKRKAEAEQTGKLKKQKEWLGLDMDIDDLSSSESDEEEGRSPSDCEAKAGTSGSAGLTDTSSGDGEDSQEAVAGPSRVAEAQTYAAIAGGSTEEDSRDAPASMSGASRVKVKIDSESSSEKCDSSQSSVTIKCEPTSDAELADSFVSVKCELSHTESKILNSQNIEEVAKTKKENSLLLSLPPPVNSSAKSADGMPVKIQEVDLDEVSCVSELEELGLDQLKLALMDRGLKCGGTLQQRAERLFSVRGLTREQIDPSLFAKPQNKKGKKK